MNNATCTKRNQSNQQKLILIIRNQINKQHTANKNKNKPFLVLPCCQNLRLPTAYIKENKQQTNYLPTATISKIETMVNSNQSKDESK